MISSFPAPGSLDDLLSWFDEARLSTAFLREVEVADAFALVERARGITVGDFREAMRQARDVIDRTDFGYLASRIPAMEDGLRALAAELGLPGTALEDLVDRLVGQIEALASGDTSRLTEGIDAGLALLEGYRSNTPLFEALLDSAGGEVGTPGDRIGTAGDDVLSGGALDDHLLGQGGDDLLRGRAGEDRLYGGDGSDRLIGGGGADTLSGAAGRDRLGGGGGRDSLAGDEGRDRLSGHGGADTLFGGDGADRLAGGGGADWIRGDDGNDRIVGGRGQDLLVGGYGDDMLKGGRHDDFLDGNFGRDVLRGGGGDDRIQGGGGFDRLFGGSGDDTLSGVNADGDWFRGGRGDDQLLGGGGPDTFVWRKPGRGDHDTISLFDPADDTIVLNGFGGYRALAMEEHPFGINSSYVRIESKGQVIDVYGVGIDDMTRGVFDFG